MSDQAIAALIVVLILLSLMALLRFRRSVVGAATVKTNEARQGLDLADGTPDDDSLNSRCLRREGERPATSTAHSRHQRARDAA